MLSSRNNPIPLSRWNLPHLSAYAVTEKTDGIRMQIELKCGKLVDNCYNIPKTSETDISALIDCEYLSDGRIFCFDLLSSDELSLNKRQECLQSIIDKVWSKSDYIIVKKQRAIADINLVWLNALRQQNKIPIDGLIFTPLQGFKSPLKWKPPEMLTVDLYVRVKGIETELCGSHGKGKKTDEPWVIAVQPTTSELNKLDGKVGEFLYESKTFNWILVKERPDKTARIPHRFGNRMINILRLQNLIRTPVTFRDLMSTDKLSFKQSYYVPQEHSFKARGGIRAHHAGIKAKLIQEYTKNAKHVIDIGFGDGSDLIRYIKSGIPSLVGVEPDEYNLEEARIKSHPSQIALLGSQIKCDVLESFPTPSRFDVCFLFFSIHYLDLEKLAKDLSRCSIVVITCLDGQLIKSAIEERKEDKLDIGIGYISLEYCGSQQPLLQVQLDSFTKDQYEKIVDINHIIQVIEQQAGKKIIRNELFPPLKKQTKKIINFSAMHRILVFKS